MLTNTIQLHVSQEHEDGAILEHVKELIDLLEAKGTKLAPKGEQGGGGWGGADADSDGDVEMS